MKKQTKIVLIVAAVVAVVAVVVALSRSRSATFDQDYHIADTSTITRVFIADKQDNHVTLQREADSNWVVDGQYAANQPLVDLLLETLRDMRIRQQVNKNAIPNAVKDLAARAIKVEVYQRKPLVSLFGGRIALFPRERLTATYHVGRETQDMMASFMYREGDKVPYIIHIPGFRGFLTPRFPADPLKWRSHTIVDLDVWAIARVELSLPETPAESFAVVREGEGFAFELLEPHRRVDGFDTARVAQMLSSFTWLNFDEFASIVPNSFADSCVSGAPRSILRVTDTAGHTTQVATYIKYSNPEDRVNMADDEMYETFDLDRLYAIVQRSADGSGSGVAPQDTVLIQYFAFDNIFQPASYFIGKDIKLQP